MLGRNPSDVLEYLKNPLNEEILKDLLKSTEKYWNQ
jgi:arsenate reductase-like glutaredoxin family protein